MELRNGNTILAEVIQQFGMKLGLFCVVIMIML